MEKVSTIKQHNCGSCISSKMVVGKWKSISTEDELTSYGKHSQNILTIGSLVCGKCRLVMYRNQHLYTSDIEDCELDPDFDVKGSYQNREHEQEHVEIPFKRVVSTHRYCFLCLSTKKLTTVPLEARL